MKNLLPRDYTRCINKNCENRLNCKRFLQAEIDLKGTKDGLVSVTKFESENCTNLINLNDGKRD